MPILIDENTYLLVQGITGRQALMNTLYMKEYGTNVVAGVRPGKGGQKVEDIPVYDTVQEARRAHPRINASVIYVPTHAVKDAVFEALEDGIRLIIITSERVPHQDVMEIAAAAKEKGAYIIGPNSIGIINPGKSVIGLIGARVDLAHEVFSPGPVGVISRSGGQTTTACYYLTKRGIGQSTALCIGGDAFVGMRWVGLLKLFQDDPETKVVVAYGEIGTTIEEEAAEFIRHGGFTKPFIVYIAGRYATRGQRFGHAGAIIMRHSGTVEYKKRALSEAGACVIDHFSKLADTVEEYLKKA